MLQMFLKKISIVLVDVFWHIIRSNLNNFISKVNKLQIEYQAE
ncbi:hypothetical protein BABL1_gene_907 [Candidatus Babela massiliensis]|uniref:Uncharacterized protein n=1 Tax=Candidatus Babela massiliensis TaxID=673862 RepID=V6DH03_9BACT|nr:hypothetical protein BABL1_gene_907 [Candidatus Babela massiliensis]